MQKYSEIYLRSDYFCNVKHISAQIQTVAYSQQHNCLYRLAQIGKINMFFAQTG